MTTPALLCGVLALLCLRALARAASRANADLPKRYANPFIDPPVVRKI